MEINFSRKDIEKIYSIAWRDFNNHKFSPDMLYIEIIYTCVKIVRNKNEDLVKYLIKLLFLYHLHYRNFQKDYLIVMFLHGLYTQHVGSITEKVKYLIHNLDPFTYSASFLYAGEIVKFVLKHENLP